MKWIKVIDKKPKIDSVVRMIGYTYIIDSTDFLPILNRTPEIAIQYEWLDESAPEESLFTLQDMLDAWDAGEGYGKDMILGSW